MARYYVSTDDDLPTVARELLDAAEDPRQVHYLAGEGHNGAFDLPDELADRYTSKAAAQARADRLQEQEELRERDAAVRYQAGMHSPTLEDLASAGEKTNSVTGTYDNADSPPAQDAPVRARRGRRPASASTATEEQ